MDLKLCIAIILANAIVMFFVFRLLLMESWIKKLHETQKDIEMSERELRTIIFLIHEYIVPSGSQQFFGHPFPVQKTNAEKTSEMDK